MKSATLFTVVSLAVLLGAGARPGTNARAAARAAQCPAVTVSCPGNVPWRGEPLTFTADLTPAPAGGPLTFAWEVSAGSITSGQNTRSITVDTTGAPGNQGITATVTVGGLAGGCPNQASCSTMVVGHIEPHPIDTYGRIPFAHEQARLDNFAIELQNDPTMQGFIVCYGGQRGRRGAALASGARAKQYLSRRRGIAPERITLIDGGFRNVLMLVLWIMPPDRPPIPSPSVDPSEVEFVKTPKRRARARRRH